VGSARVLPQELLDALRRVSHARSRQTLDSSPGGCFVFESGRRRDSNTKPSNISKINMVAPTGTAEGAVLYTIPLEVVALW
jgi:hypothetical protein